MRAALAIALVVLPATAHAGLLKLPHIPKIPKSAKATRMADACAIAALAVGEVARTDPHPIAARTRSPVLMGMPRELWFKEGVQQPLDLRKCTAVVEIGLQAGVTLWGPGSPPDGPRYSLSDPSFSRDRQSARISMARADDAPRSVTFAFDRTVVGWQLAGISQRGAGQ